MGKKISHCPQPGGCRHSHFLSQSGASDDTRQLKRGIKPGFLLCLCPIPGSAETSTWSQRASHGPHRAQNKQLPEISKTPAEGTPEPASSIAVPLFLKHILCCSLVRLKFRLLERRLVRKQAFSTTFLKERNRIIKKNQSPCQANENHLLFLSPFPPF